jgi:hypothetical protein
MAGRASQVDHEAAISRATRVGPQASAFREHLLEVAGGVAFKGSRRSQEFLKHIVEKALQGRFDDLKERALGVEIFGRPAWYDTGEDAIGRVTASDVRRRLHDFYSDSTIAHSLHIDLPSGSYIPEFRHLTKEVPPLLKPEAVLEEATTVAEEPSKIRQPRVGRPAVAFFAGRRVCRFVPMAVRPAQLAGQFFF